METLLYACEISDMTDDELFVECMKELYPDTKHDRKGWLIHELMRRLEDDMEDEE